MGIIYSIRRLNDFIGALKTKGKLEKAGIRTQGDLRAYQQQQLSALVAHSVQNSPFYRELYAGIDCQNAVLSNLPVINKQVMMANFDRFVTDPRLNLGEIQSHISQISQDSFFKKEFRVTSTSGSSGFKGIFVSSRKDWSTALASFMRCGSFMGVTPRIPRMKIASIVADNPIHVTYRMNVSTDIGIMNALRLDATTGIDKLVTALNDFQPEALNGYPSVVSLLADEQKAGRLKINPKVIWTFSEVCTSDMKQNIIEGWGPTPFDVYGLTETGTSLGCECSWHRGIHIFEDMFIVEVVDDQNRPVPDGSPGAKILLTNLLNYSQPLIRYEVSDIVTISPHMCPCLSPFRLISSIDGRSDDIIFLDGVNGQKVPAHPVHIYTAMGLVKEVKQYQVINRPDGLHIKLVLQDGADSAEASAKVRHHLRSSLESLGAKNPAMTVQIIERFERDQSQMGKFKMVISAT